jgi:hypothetical protein
MNARWSCPKAALPKTGMIASLKLSLCLRVVEAVVHRRIARLASAACVS